jgi:hypothetical protein
MNGTFLPQLDFFLKRKMTFDEYSQGRSVQVSETGPFMIGRTGTELESNARTQLSKFGQEGSARDLLNRLKSKGAACGTLNEFVQFLVKKLDAGVQKFYFQTLMPENTSDRAPC